MLKIEFKSFHHCRMLIFKRGRIKLKSKSNEILDKSFSFPEMRTKLLMESLFFFCKTKTEMYGVKFMKVF